MQEDNQGIGMRKSGRKAGRSRRTSMRKSRMINRRESRRETGGTRMSTSRWEAWQNQENK
jgi:hypothetical protein